MYLTDPKLVKSKADEYSTDELISVLDGKKAVGLDERIEPIFVHTAGNDSVAFIRINCKDVSLPPYQRNLNQKTVNEIKKGIFYQPLGCTVHLHERQENGKWFYTCLDGQHRTYTNPAGVMIGVVSNSLPEPLIFSMANNKKGKKNTTPEDDFHANCFLEDSLERKLRNAIEQEFGITIKRHPNHASGVKRKDWEDVTVYEWGGTMVRCYNEIHAKVRKFYEEIVWVEGRDKPITQYKISQDEIHNQTMNILLNSLQLVKNTLGFEEMTVSNKRGATNGLSNFYESVKWMLGRFGNSNNAVNEDSIPFGDIELAWKHNRWAKSNRSNAAVFPIPELTFAMWRTVSDQANGKEVKKAHAKMRNLFSMIYFAWEIEQKKGA